VSQDFDARERFGVLAEKHVQKPAVNCGIKMFGDCPRVVLLKELSFLLLQAGSVATVPTDGAEVCTAPESSMTRSIRSTRSANGG
jgi:hypothetical protein